MTMKKTLLSILSLVLLVVNTLAQKTHDMDLWPKGLPNSNGIDQSQPFDDAKQNFKPSIKVYLPDKKKATGAAVVCCPGGGYSHLAMDHEGHDWAKYFNEKGIALIVLKYRMPHTVQEVPYSDAEEALRLVRENAKKWDIDPGKVGIMGSSAGGHLAATIATHCTNDNRPDFQILFYPVITMDRRYTHGGSRDNLIGKETGYDLVKAYSNELQVSQQTPPAIILLSDDDTAVRPYNGVSYYLALKEAGVKASLHVYPSGGHGWGSRDNFKYHTEMLADLTAWLDAMGLTKK